MELIEKIWTYSEKQKFFTPSLTAGIEKKPYSNSSVHDNIPQDDTVECSFCVRQHQFISTNEKTKYIFVVVHYHFFLTILFPHISLHVNDRR